MEKGFRGLDGWISREDLAAGTFWSESLQKELDGFDAAILCLTPENTRSPWMLFEAGALMKATDTSRVIPYWFFQIPMFKPRIRDRVTNHVYFHHPNVND